MTRGQAVLAVRERIGPKAGVKRIGGSNFVYDNYCEVDEILLGMCNTWEEAVYVATKPKEKKSELLQPNPAV